MRLSGPPSPGNPSSVVRFGENKAHRPTFLRLVTDDFGKPVSPAVSAEGQDRVELSRPQSSPAAQPGSETDRKPGPKRVEYSKGPGYSQMKFAPVLEKGRAAVAKTLREFIETRRLYKGLQDSYTVNPADADSMYALSLKLPGYNDRLEIRLPGVRNVSPVYGEDTDPAAGPELCFFEALRQAETIVYRVVEGDDPQHPHADAWINDLLANKLVPATHEV